MRKRFVLLPAAALLICCSKASDGEYVVTGTVNGVADGKNVFLEKNDEQRGLVAIDTAVIKDGKFEFQGKAGEPEMHGIQVEGIQNKSYVILESGEINIEIDKDSIFKNKLTGTYNNEQLTAFNDLSAKISKKVRAFEKNNTQKLILAQNAKDSATIKSLQAQYQDLQKELETSTFKYIEEHPKAFVSALLIQSMFNIFDPPMDRIEKYYAALSPELKKSKVGRDIEKKINEFKVVQVGRRAPDFTAPDPNGKPVSLKQSMGKLTIIDFWASWCGPCRKANPELVALYREFHDKGLNIIGVSLDKPGQADRWKEAIAKDGLTWTQVSNLKEWSDPIAAQYGVQAIPAMFLVNEHGVVVAKDLHGDKLREKVEQFLLKKAPAKH